MQLLCLEHCLAIEELHHNNRRRPQVPREERLCCFCHTKVEDELHALLFCQSCPMKVKERRVVLMENAKQALPEVNWDAKYADRHEYLRVFLYHNAAILEFARFLYHLLWLFSKTAL